MLWLLLIALIVVALWFYFKPVWAPKPDQLQAEVQKNLRLAVNQASKMYQGARGKLKLRRDTHELAGKYKQWVANSSLSQAQLYAGLPSAAENFSAWLAGLSPKETQAFCDQIAHFCASLGFDLAWLVDDKLNGQPELKKVIEEAAALYSITAWRATQVHTEVETYLAYERWLVDPKKQKVFGQKLYGELVTKGLVTLSPNMYLAPEKDRSADAVRAIKQIAAEQPAAFIEILRGVINPAPVPSQNS